MATKEQDTNIYKRSKIPVRKDRMLKRKAEEENAHPSMREPLRTLANQNQQIHVLAGPSHDYKVLDTRNVTHRNTNEELDWNFDLFKDDSQDSTKNLRDHVVKNTNIFEVQKEKHEQECVLNVTQQSQDDTSLLNTAVSEVFDGNSLDQNLFKVTPTVIPSNDEEQRKINLLKTPLRREHVILSPISGISCQWPAKLSEDTKHPKQIVAGSSDAIHYLNGEYITDNLFHIQQVETKAATEPYIRSASRSCVINWIINGRSGDPLVVEKACWYMDHYLMTTQVSVEKLQVIAAACFWIATKFHGRHISGRRLTKYAGSAFLENDLLAAERNILRKLNYKALPVTPHDFVPYLAWLCEKSSSGSVEAAATFLCQTGLMVNKHLCQEYPSVVAVAAVKNALILLRRNALLFRLMRSRIYHLAEKKATDLSNTCAQLIAAVRVVTSAEYEYKAPLFKFSGPPHNITTKIVRAVNHKNQN